nr:phage minor head protein [uncultured Acetatifactor sp.]
MGDVREQALCYQMIAKAIISNADGILDAIDRYLAKADDDLADTLEEEGFAEGEETVKAIDSLQEDVAEALQSQTEAFVAALEDAPEGDWEEVQKNVAGMLEDDDIAERIGEAAAAMFEAEIPKLATVYMKETDGELVVDAIRKRTESWFASWSEELGRLMHISTHKEITDAIKRTIDEGEGIPELTRKIMDGGWRSEYYKAKRVAVTEVLRAHSVAREEAIQQSPSTDRKEWRHTGAHKNEPRPNHVDMDGQIVPKKEPFELKGTDGKTYHPMYPRDPCLPPGESVNCHCIHRGIAADDAIGMSLEERRRLQQKYIEEDDAAWKKELDEQNKAKAGITPYSALENFKGKAREEQVKYLGKTKMALYDAGLIDSDEMLAKVKKNSLQKLQEDGIFTVSNSVLKHSTVGDFTNTNRLAKGGHSQASMDAMDEKGITYHVKKTYSNGVRIGHVEGHKSNLKNGIVTTKYPNADIGQAWFPKEWTEDDVRNAGTYVANKGTGSGAIKFADYKGVKVGIFVDADGSPTTIFPHNMEQPKKDGTIEGARD